MEKSKEAQTGKTTVLYTEENYQTENETTGIWLAFAFVLLCIVGYVCASVPATLFCIGMFAFCVINAG